MFSSDCTLGVSENFLQMIGVLKMRKVMHGMQIPSHIETMVSSHAYTWSMLLMEMAELKEMCCCYRGQWWQ
jgi:hypothetical protein